MSHSNNPYKFSYLERFVGGLILAVVGGMFFAVFMTALFVGSIFDLAGKAIALVRRKG